MITPSLNNNFIDIFRYVNSNFSKLRVSKRWSFIEKRSTELWTHGYHRYPAKFLPHIVGRLIKNYAKDNEIIADLFAGCGTTLVEAKVLGRKSVGVDINPVAKLITSAKINPIDPEELVNAKKILIKKITKYKYDKNLKFKTHNRISYWFRKRESHKIFYLLTNILAFDKPDIKNFYLCALSNILKNSSRWLQSSTKPQIDPYKNISDPFQIFMRQVSRMLIQNKKFYENLKDNKKLSTSCRILLADSRDTKLRSNSIGTIITSPPYVTSYEYADIHQLTGYWFNYIDDMKEFRKNFIGTFYSNTKSLKVQSEIAQNIVNKLNDKNKKSACEIANYFNDMYEVVVEMRRILKKDGIACLVVGNTKIKNIKIKTAQVFTEMLISKGFLIEKIILRKVPSKLLPTIRDKKTGKFTTLSNPDSAKIYPEEYIIIVRKTNACNR